MDTEEPREQLESAVRQLLVERQQLLVTFCRAAGIAPGAAKEDEKSVLLHLCQVLMDYAALWQFEIHDALSRDDSPASGASDVLQAEQPMLMQAAKAMLDFNDLVDVALLEGRLMDLDPYLSSLGEVLAERFEAEDRVITVL
ncbi:Rsd/AlgQ family anti-sigma factor [Thiolapillus brandeum]|uniref:Rsd/AlgQ family anti-sigma factor n=1 Tax=Thiolapillus brandeum TaxID=1076588 RepID=UPI000596D47B|nr:Rsd/AlgQ family anti-sigma factor [Thiolapillus brandeum]